MLQPKNEDFNFDFSFRSGAIASLTPNGWVSSHLVSPDRFWIPILSDSNYYHVLYKKDDFISLEADAVQGIKSWRFTKGGTQERAVARGGQGGGFGYGFRSQPHVCFCGCKPCPHVEFTGTPTIHKVLACKQAKTDREQAEDFFSTIEEGTPLACAGDPDDSSSGGEPLWLSIAKDRIKVADKAFQVAGGVGRRATRTILPNCTTLKLEPRGDVNARRPLRVPSMAGAFVDIGYLVKIKTDAEGNIVFEKWSQPHGQSTCYLLLHHHESSQPPRATRYSLHATRFSLLRRAYGPHQAEDHHDEDRAAHRRERRRHAHALHHEGSGEPHVPLISSLSAEGIPSHSE
jgi:hypothetical protein